MGSQGQVDRAPDPLTHFADTRRRRPLVAHFGASAKSRHWAPESKWACILTSYHDEKGTEVR